LMIGAMWDEQALSAEPGGWLSPEKLGLVSKAALAACHGEDGVIADPGQCRFDPSALLCKAGQSDACLAAPEVATLRKIYSGPQDSEGKTLFPGFAPGGEAGRAAWGLWITGAEPKRGAGSLLYFFGTGFYSNMVYDKP